MTRRSIALPGVRLRAMLDNFNVLLCIFITFMTCNCLHTGMEGCSAVHYLTPPPRPLPQCTQTKGFSPTHHALNGLNGRLCAGFRSLTTCCHFLFSLPSRGAGAVRKKSAGNLNTRSMGRCVHILSEDCRGLAMRK